jgi:hypothetical protein
MIRVTIILTAIAVALSGCAGNREADLGACKVKALEVIKDQAKERRDYVYNCMVAAGYKYEDGLPSCIEAKISGDEGISYLCFYPNNFVNRLIRIYYGG